MSEARKFYNACLYLTRFRYFEYIGKTDKLDYNIRKEYDLEDWFAKDVYPSQMESYGDEFIKKVSSYIKSTLKQKELQTILRQLASDWKGNFNKKAKARENKNSKEKINIPYYKKDDFMTTEYNKQMILFRDFEKDNKMGLTGAEGRIELPKWLKKEDIQAARLKIRNGYVYLEVIYNKSEKKKKPLNKDNYCSIDTGLNIFSALTFNKVMKPIGISGLKLKSINQNYNKRVSKIDSLISNTYNNKNLKKLSLLKNSVTEKRNLKIEHELHKISNYIVNLLVEKDIGNLIIGYNKKQKDKIKIGKRNNQNFVMIPFTKFTKILEYKCEEFGINFIPQEESYTSKSSFLSNDILPIYKDDEEEKIDYNFSGYRRKRGLYRDTKLKRYIQADVNGSYNIMRKNGISLKGIQDYYNSQDKTTVIDFYGITL